MNFYNLFARNYISSGKRMCEDSKGFIKKGSRILDLGCGSGIISKELHNFFESDVLGVDIEDRRSIDIPFQIIDGENLPFSENSFDTVFISYVLHHSEFPISLLKEAKRVSRRNIIIYEDLPEGLLSSLFCRIHNITWNCFFKEKKSVSNNGSFKTEKEWKEIFKNLGLKVIFKKEISFAKFLYPVKKIFFVLGV